LHLGGRLVVAEQLSTGAGRRESGAVVDEDLDLARARHIERECRRVDDIGDATLW